MLIEYIKGLKYESEPYVIQSVYASKLSNLIGDLLSELGAKKHFTTTQDSYESMQFGLWYENLRIEQMRKRGILIAPEEDNKQISVIQGIVKGKIDAIVNLEGEQVIVEIKTSKILPEEPKIEHLYQICYYVAYHPCDYGILHYADYARNVREFKINKSSEIINRVKEKVERINELYNKKQTNGFKELS